MRTPAVGSPERTAIVDSLRKPVQEYLKKPIVFKITTFNVLGDWAFLIGTPLQPGEKAMDYRGTPLEDSIREGAFDDWFCALLKKDKRL